MSHQLILFKKGGERELTLFSFIEIQKPSLLNSKDELLKESLKNYQVFLIIKYITNSPGWCGSVGWIVIL